MVISQSGKSQEIWKKDTLMSHTQPDVFGPSVNSVDELQTEEGQLGDFLPNRPDTCYTRFGIGTNAHRCAR
jgi:hypothetical protein